MMKKVIQHSSLPNHLFQNHSLVVRSDEIPISLFFDIPKRSD